MRPHDSAVQHRVFVVGILGERLEYLLPYPLFSPATQAGMNGFPRAKPFRQIPPRYPGPVAVKNGINEKPTVFGSDTDRVFPTRQHILDPIPLVVA